MSSKFNVGDRVVAIKDFQCGHIEGKHGTVLGFHCTSRNAGIAFDDAVNGLHGLQEMCGNGASCKNRHGWFVSDECLKLEEKELFKVGDRIEMVKDYGWAKGGTNGKIVTTRNDDFGVRFDGSFSGGHDLDGHCENDFGQWVSAESMKLIPAESKFSVGQIYKVGLSSSERGNTIKIISVTDKDNFNVGYKTIKGEKLDSDTFGDKSIYAKELILLTGAEIGEAIREDRPAAVKEVSRKAKVGEYIKILKNLCEEVQRGAIGKVTSIYDASGRNNMVYFSFGGRSNWLVGACDGEYVVLENYKPSEPKVSEIHAKAKVGDTIKVLHENLGEVKRGTIWEVTRINSLGTLTVRNDEFGGSWSVSPNNYVILSSPKHQWTTAEIEKAKALVLDTIREVYAESKGSIVFSVDINFNGVTYAHLIKKGVSRLAYNNGANTLKAVDVPAGKAQCSSTDEPNEWIGKAVALCKLLHKPIPAFIMGEKTLKFSFEKAKAKAYDSSDSCVRIYCKDDEEAHSLLKELDTLGYKWLSGNKLAERFYAGERKFNAYDNKIVSRHYSDGSKSVNFSDCFTEE